MAIFSELWKVYLGHFGNKLFICSCILTSRSIIRTENVLTENNLLIELQKSLLKQLTESISLWTNLLNVDSLDFTFYKISSF